MGTRRRTMTSFEDENRLYSLSQTGRVEMECLLGGYTNVEEREWGAERDKNLRMRRRDMRIREWEFTNTHRSEENWEDAN